ncbi:SMI1/KNR4 family protein [Streptomyces sp. NPDC032198]|uniref:SMI1/KNR4 family protein n=1 Tax=Streptomyces sp. NPDC032198 TaxID=3155127 RepID=UPI0033C04F3B
MSSSRIIQAWSRIDTWLAEQAPVTFAALPRPATHEQIASAEQQIGVAFPSELYASLRCHNGSGDVEILPGHTLLSAELIAADFLLAVQISRDPYTDTYVNTQSPEWIPISGDGGGSHYVLGQLGGAQPRVGFRNELGDLDFAEGVMGSCMSDLLEKAAGALAAMEVLDDFRPVVVDRELEWEME